MSTINEHLDTSLIERAINALQENHGKSIPLTAENTEFKKLADTGISPETVDTSDLFALLEQKDKLPEVTYKKLLGFFSIPENENSEINITHELLTLKSGSAVAVTVYKPNKINPEQPPIIFSGGLFHKTGLYTSFLTQLAQSLGCPIYAYDSPGCGGSTVTGPVRSELLTEAMKAVIKHYTTRNSPVIVAGHSKGTLPVRDLAYDSEFQDQIVRYILLSPIAALGREKGLSLSPKFIASSGLNILKNKGYLEPDSDDATEYYLSKNDPYADPLQASMDNEELCIRVRGLARALIRALGEPIATKKNHGKINRIEITLIIPEADQLMPFNQKKWDKREETLKESGLNIVRLSNAPHSFPINADPWMEELIESFRYEKETPTEQMAAF